MSEIEAMVVVRRIRQRPAAVEAALDGIPLGATGWLRLEMPFERRMSEPVPGWHARGRLHGSSPSMARYTRVQIEVSALSAAECEMRLWPASERSFRWGRRRQRRYFELAHRAADQLVSWTKVTQPADHLCHRPARLVQPVAGVPIDLGRRRSPIS